MEDEEIGRMEVRMKERVKSGGTAGGVNEKRRRGGKQSEKED